MKKVMSLLIAITMVCTSAGMSFAANLTTDKLVVGLSGQISTQGLTFGTDSGIALSENSFLSPGKEYKFEIMTIKDGEKVGITSEELENYNFYLECVKGKDSIEKITVEKIGNQYFLVISTKINEVTQAQEVKYELKFINPETAQMKFKATIEFKSGYKTADNKIVNAIDKNDTIYVNIDKPLFTTEQVETISKKLEREQVTLTNTIWEYKVDLMGTQAINMSYHSKPDQNLVDQFKDRPLKFLTFEGRPEFYQRGEFKITLNDSEIDLFNQRYFVYDNRDGNLVRVPSVTYDHADKTLYFPTKKLGNYVITNKEIQTETIMNLGSGSSSETVVFDADKQPAQTGGVGGYPTQINQFMAYIVRKK
ncbi:MAG: hypothetical protein RSB96_01245 [Oscillospiraceae bacterium]